MVDVRDLEVPPAHDAWDAAPPALRAAVTIFVPVAALAALRIWMVLGQWPAFQRTFGRTAGLDMTTPAGWVTAGLRTPGQGSALLDAAAVLLLAALAVAVLRRVSEARWFTICLAVGVAVDALASLAYPVPWWYAVATGLFAGWLVLLVVLLTRPATIMHLRPEPLALRESWLHGERPLRRDPR